MTNQEKIKLMESRINILASNGKDNQNIITKIKRNIRKLESQSN